MITEFMRNDIMRRCTKQRHSFVENIEISISSGLIIETIVGGRREGIHVDTVLFPNEHARSLEISVFEHYSTLKKLYLKEGKTMPKDK